MQAQVTEQKTEPQWSDKKQYILLEPPGRLIALVLYQARKYEHKTERN